MQAQPHYIGLTQTLIFYLERMFLGYRETPQILTNWDQSLFGIEFVRISRKIYRNERGRLWCTVSELNVLDWQNMAK